MDTRRQVIRINLNRMTIADDNLDNKRMLLSWSIRNGYPRVSVYYGKNPEVSSYENMTILPFTTTGIMSLLGFIREVAIDESGEKKYSVSCYNNKFVDNVRTDDKIIAGTIIVERDADGVVCLKVKSNNKPDVRFRLLIDKEWFKVYNKNDEEITTKKELSSIYAKSYSDMLLHVIGDLSRKEAYESRVFS